MKPVAAACRSGGRAAVVCTLLALALALPSGTTATTWTIWPGGPMTIQDAVDASSFSGDTLLLQPGTYTGPGNRDVTIQSRQLVITSSAGAAATIIDCESTGRGLAIQDVPSGTLVVSGLTFRNAYQMYNTRGAALLIHGAPSSASVLVEGNVFEHNVAGGYSSTWHGGIGGAVEVRDYHAVIEGNRFESNASGQMAGALSVYNCPGATVQDNDFVNNTSEAHGILPEEEYVDGRGGALLIVGGPVTISGNRFVGNSGAMRGGALYCWLATATVENNTFENNQSTGNGFMDGTGGAIHVEGGSVSVGMCLFLSNRSLTGGGAIWVGSGDHEITSSTFVGNGDSGGFAGGAAIVVETDAPTVSACIFAYNSASPGRHVVDCRGTVSPSEPSISCCDFYGNTPDDEIGWCYGATIADTIRVDPLFCDRGDGDYTLADASPCALGNNTCGVLMGAFAPACQTVPVLFQAIDSEVWAFGVRIRWRLHTDENLVELRVYRSDGEGGDSVLRARVSDVTLQEFVDEDVAPGAAYTYAVTAVASDGTQTTSSPVHVRVPRAALRLDQNHPNPFTTATTVRFVLDEEREVDLAVFDVSGRRVATLVSGTLPAGQHAVAWNDTGAISRLASGIYFCRLSAGERVLSRKMIHIR